MLASITLNNIINWAKSITTCEKVAAAIVIFLERDRTFSQVFGLPCAPSLNDAIGLALEKSNIKSLEFKHARQLNNDLALARETYNAVRNEDLDMAVALYRQLGTALDTAKIFDNVNFGHLFNRLDELKKERAEGIALQDEWLSAFQLRSEWLFLKEQDLSEIICYLKQQ